MVVSFSQETNVPTVNPFFLASSSWCCINSHTCFINGGSVSFVLSITLSSLDVRYGHLPLSCFRRYTNDSSCFSAPATLLQSCMGRLELLVEPTIVSSRLENHKLAVKWLITGWSSVISDLNLSCLTRFESSKHNTSSNTIEILGSLRKILRVRYMCAHAATTSDFSSHQHAQTAAFRNQYRVHKFKSGWHARVSR